MKMSESNQPTPNSYGYWQSLEELAEEESFLRQLESEFGGDANDPPAGLSRRSFLQVMSASVALAGLSGCRWPQEEIIPFDRRPESYRPGKIARFATTLDIAGVARPVLVSSYDGRPIKIEGNPDHALSRGAADAITQAAVLELYDRDRSRQPLRRGAGGGSWEEFANFARERFGEGTNGAGIAVLSEPLRSPSLERMARALQERLPELRWYQHSPATGNEAEGLAQVFEQPAAPTHRLHRARVIVDLDADLLVGHAEGVRNANAFAEARRPERGSMNRLYSFAPLLTPTAAVADHHFAVSPTDLLGVLAALAGKLRGSGALQQGEALAGVETLVAAAQTPAPALAEALAIVAEDLLAHQGRSIVAIGPHHPAAAHAVVHRLNLALGNGGRTLHYRRRPVPLVNVEPLAVLVARMQAGTVDTLVILGANPVYDAPADLDFSAALAKVEEVVTLGLFEDETARLAGWHLPQAHALESWGDWRDLDGRLCATQPLIEPLFGGRTAAELVALLSGEEARQAHQIARDTFAAETGGLDALLAPSFGKNWRRYLHDGFLADGPEESAPAQVRTRAAWSDLARAFHTGQNQTGIELALRLDAKLWDGRYANNAWLQELPDTSTKLTWDNAALLGPALAAELDLEHGEVVRIDAGGRQAELPVYVLPGMAAKTVSVALGYGRSAAGRVGNGVGVDSYVLRTTKALWGTTGITITSLGRSVELASTQNQFAIDSRGAKERVRRIDSLVREGTLEEYAHHPEFAQHMGIHHPPLKSLWQEHEGEGHQWGMTIDLNACVSCNACVVACQAENNIPVVGKEQVLKGREMHWLRIDRYFHGDPDSAAMAQQPMACGHCELAPCEQVCPVGATMHSTEGLNVMAYNRCVGTRYCSNNCPYKVRRFNFFNYHKDVVEVEKLGANPEVSIRARGVMEKCTYCVQRIEHARIAAKNENRELRDGDIVTACQQTCPTQAIQFGDLSDSRSQVSRLHDDDRAYALLSELNIKPRTRYLARVRNPHPKLAAVHQRHEPAIGGHPDNHTTASGDHHG